MLLDILAQKMQKTSLFFKSHPVALAADIYPILVTICQKLEKFKARLNLLEQSMSGDLYHWLCHIFKQINFLPDKSKPQKNTSKIQEQTISSDSLFHLFSLVDLIILLIPLLALLPDKDLLAVLKISSTKCSDLFSSLAAL